MTQYHQDAFYLRLPGDADHPFQHCLRTERQQGFAGSHPNGPAGGENQRRHPGGKIIRSIHHMGNHAPSPPTLPLCKGEE